LRSLTRRFASEDGWSFAEIMVTLLIMSIGAAFFSTFLITAQRSINTQQERSNNNDAARLAVERLDREIRSGNVLYDPQIEFDPYYSLRVYTQSNQDPQCVQWRINGESLERRSWEANGSPPASLGWSIITEGIVNKVQSTHAFTLDPDTSKSGRTVIVEILAADSAGSSRPSRVKASITGRNTTFNYPVTACALTPPV
jgi:type II secretory pathway component PulJ